MKRNYMSGAQIAMRRSRKIRQEPDYFDQREARAFIAFRACELIIVCAMVYVVVLVASVVAA